MQATLVITDDDSEKSLNYQLLGEGTHKVNGKTVEVDMYELKKALWLAINSVNILEGIALRSFACSCYPGELKKMEGNAKIIKFICLGDENVHLASTQAMLKLSPKMIKILPMDCKRNKSQCEKMFVEAVEQECAWADYLFKDGSMIGLNAQLLKDYVEWTAHKRMLAVGLTSLYKGGSNSFGHKTGSSGAEVQVVHKKQKYLSYVIGGTKQDVDTETFKGFSL